jgi:hypothetical protein
VPVPPLVQLAEADAVNESLGLARREALNLDAAILLGAEGLLELWPLFARRAMRDDE